MYQKKAVLLQTENKRIKVMKKINLLLTCLGALFLGSCSSNDDASNNGSNGTDGANTSINSSKALTYVSVYTDADCKNPLIENAPLTGELTDLSFPLTYGVDKVYIKYPTASGSSVISQEIENTNLSQKESRAAAGSWTYFDYETDKYTTLTVAMPENAVKNYVTNADGFTNYHSSGVVMFEDTWPSKSNVDNVGGTSLFGDFNDFVVDYDLESTVNDAADTLQTWKEDLKVVMHLRAMGGKYARRFGLLLEGLDEQYVVKAKTEISVTLGNYTVPTQNLKAEVVWEDGHPIIYVNDVNKLINSSFMSANGMTLGSNSGLYNVENNNTLNVGSNLFTVTVTFRGKDHTELLSATDREKQTENYKNAVVNTRLQNFFLVTEQGGKTYETHMPNYAPTKSYTSYESDKNDKAAGDVVAKDNSNTYTSATGESWAFKVPVLTRHATEHTSFTTAYPQYAEWLQSKTNADWYKNWNDAHGKDPIDIGNKNGSVINKQPLLYIIEPW